MTVYEIRKISGKLLIRSRLNIKLLRENQMNQVVTTISPYNFSEFEPSLYE